MVALTQSVPIIGLCDPCDRRRLNGRGPERSFRQKFFNPPLQVVAGIRFPQIPLFVHQPHRWYAMDAVLNAKFVFSSLGRQNIGARAGLSSEENAEASSHPGQN